jgi:hypothetical protein
MINCEIGKHVIEVSLKMSKNKEGKSFICEQCK